MAKRPVAFRQADLKRALRAAKGAGLEVARVEIDPTTGRIVIITDVAARSVAELPALDQWMANHARPT
jgi:hypothetical protein